MKINNFHVLFSSEVAQMLLILNKAAQTKETSATTFWVLQDLSFVITPPLHCFNSLQYGGANIWMYSIALCSWDNDNCNCRALVLLLPSSRLLPIINIWILPWFYVVMWITDAHHPYQYLEVFLRMLPLYHCKKQQYIQNYSVW